ncbi:hypothetical protein FOA52_014066 [Chlamydomonas sp. UWO 241]|nr:hypothetical protein FOA52_014066 [Chlamydomonas sp. UWO 241]
MDETRATRVREHFSHHKALKAWRADVHGRLAIWRHELRTADRLAAAVDSEARAVTSAETKAVSQAAAAGQQVAELEKEVRRAQLDHDTAILRLARANRAEAREARLARVKQARRAQLLEASRRWVGSPEELSERIAAALDNPQPFGFITNLPRTTL